LNSSQFGLFWFNKRTGETRNQPPQELVMLQQQLQEQREEEIAFVHQTMEELEATKYVYEQEQIRSEALESDLAQMAQQLDETGRALDEANEQKAQYNAELNAKTAELAELNSLIQDLKVQITALSPLPDELQNVKLSLHVAEETISKRDVIIVEREESLQHLREQTSDLTARLEEANSLIASTSDALASVRNELNEERSKTKTLQKDLQFIPILQEELERAQDQLVKLQKSFEEKSTALSQTRKTMRNVRERNAELEKELGNMAELRDKLHQSRCETRTVKQLLAGKSTIMQERTRSVHKDSRVRHIIQ
jgi:chromosome segregation ATPase